MLSSKRHLDLVLVVALAVAQFALSFAPNFGGPLRVAIGIPAVVFAPGYALTAAVWAPGRLPSIERFALSLGLSLSVATLGGLALYALGVGLWPVPWAVLLGALMLIGAVFALRRRVPVLGASTNGVAGHAPARPLSWRGLALGIAALAVSIGAVAVAVVGASQPREDFSQLWLLPASGSVQVGLRSQELVPTTFHVQVLDGQSIVQDTPEIRLTPGQTWTTTVQLPPAVNGESVQALVFRSDAPQTPYRRAQLQPAQTGP